MKLLVKEQIKTLLAQEGVQIKQLAQMISEKTGKLYSADAISHKLSRGTMSYNEVLNIAEILGYKILFKKEN